MSLITAIPTSQARLNLMGLTLPFPGAPSFERPLLEGWETIDLNPDWLDHAAALPSAAKVFCDAMIVMQRDPMLARRNFPIR
jgi:hypothetical protein